MTTSHGTPDNKPDMPDTTNAYDASHTRGPGEQEHDDAAGYYVPGEPIQDTKAPGDEKSVMGPYLPQGTYMSVQQFERNGGHGRGCSAR